MSAKELDLSSLSGLEFIQGLMDGSVPNLAAMDETLNFEAVEVGEGMCVLEGVPLDAHMNLHGAVHGGWYVAILDTAANYAVASALKAGYLCVTATFEAKLIRPIEFGKVYHARAQIINVGRSLGHSRAELIDVETGKVCGSASCTNAIMARS